jgi:5'(3')-deoxyribonucleotidase
VVADFNAGWISLYNAEFGTELHPGQVVMWDAPTLLTHFEHMGEFWRWAAKASTSPAGNPASIFRVLSPYPEALDALHRLARRHHIVILTTKPNFAVHDTYEWLAEHRLPTTEVHILDDKTHVDCDVYLDDADHNLQALHAAHPGSMVCRFVRPWNEAHIGVIGIEDWAEFETRVDKRSLT